MPEPTAKWTYDDANLIATSQKAVGLLINENNGLGGVNQFVRGYLQKWNFRWDKNGSLSERADTTNGADWKEAFTYDSLDRLTNVKQVRSNGVTSNLDTLILGYDQLGNITSKSGTGTANLGSYLYKSFEAGCANQAGPHAASLVNGKSYCYDPNGNNTEVRKNGSVIRTIVYTGFDLAESIVRDELTPEGRIQAQVSFKYGTDRAMFKRVDGGSGSNCASPDGMFCARFEDSDTPITPGIASKTTYYVGNVEFIREGMVDKVKRYIGNYLVITNIGNSSATYDYLLRDSLGSIDTIASETGAIKLRQSFNAHGQRRTAATTVAGSWNVLNPLQISLFDTSTTTQGYTGHEQLDAVGLVHMGARLYDPELGRFIQADDFVEPEATQGLNRYSYVLNNPLSATDPTGNFSFRQALGVVVGIVAAIASAGASTLLNGFLIATAGGFASAVIATGSLKAGLWGAVSAAVFFGIGSAFQVDKFAAGAQAGKTGAIAAVKSGMTAGQTLAKIAAHAGAGGTLTMLQGGKFGHGFVAAGFTEALSPAVGQLGDGKDFGTVLARTAASAAIGGTASSLSGGSFANGAKTAAFQELFNHTAHSIQDAMKPEDELDTSIGTGDGMFSSGLEGGGPNECWPTGHAEVISGFGMRPRGGVMEMHPGVDIRAHLNDPIYSTQTGVVNFIGPQTAAGFTLNVIRITNDSNGSISGYGHTAPVAGLTVNQHISCGQQIGFSDGSGPVVPQLHLSYRASATSPMIDALSNQLQNTPRPH